MPETVRFDHYEVLRRDDGSLYELGRGAMGITYKAFDTNLQCPVALKVINAATLHSALAQQRFVREARSAAQLRHRNVASVFHLGTGGDTYFYAMEFIDGETLEAFIRRRGALEPTLALKIAAQVARALNAAARFELVHRDIKPANLMLVHEDEELVVKVIDFGLAKSSRKEEGADPTAVSLGGFVGTPHFASPEQLEEKEIDVRSDLYSLGVTLWYMLAGRTPFAGSLAQVMSQHLQKPPPVEQYPEWPEPLVNLLQRLMAKDPADRPQTPAAARVVIERCAEQLAPKDEQEFATMAAAPAAEQPASFAIGNLLAGRYRLVEDRGDTNAGHVFRADCGGRPVRILQVHGDLAPELFTAIEREVEKLARLGHPNVLATHGLERVAEGSFLVFEWTVGFPLTELLRRRRALDPTETVALLTGVAAAVDFAVANGLKRLDLSLSQIRVHFPEIPQENAARELLARPVDTWPPFVAKVNPVTTAAELSMAETWAGGQTVVGGMAAGAADSGQVLELGPRYHQALAALAYELLGGAQTPLPPGGAAGGVRCAPLASLTEGGNEVLWQALDPARSFPAATAMIEALREAESGAPRRRLSPAGGATRIGTTYGPADSPAAAPAATAGPAAPGIATGPPPPAAVPTVGPSGRAVAAAGSSPKGPFILVVIGFGVVALGLLVFIALNLLPAKKRPWARPAAAATPVPAVAPTPGPVAAAQVMPTPAAAAAPAATPAPTPSRQDELRRAVAAAEKLEATSDWRGCVEAYLGVAKEFAESDVGRVRLEMVLARVRAAGGIGAGDFGSWRSPLGEAAGLNIVSAMMLLADNLRPQQPRDAFNWYCAAAAAGQASAMTQIGLLYSNGAGVERDLRRAVDWFRRATDLGDVAGRFLLAECFLAGKGVAKDEAAGVALLEQAMAGGDSRAANQLGICYQRGVGVGRDAAEARRLFERAADLGQPDALGNLGVLHMNGEGVARDPAKAVQCFERGAKKGSGFCMFLYARCLEGGIGIEANSLAATTWYRKAAVAGHPGAIDWCRKNGVPVAAER